MLKLLSERTLFSYILPIFGLRIFHLNNFRVSLVWSLYSILLSMYLVLQYIISSVELIRSEPVITKNGLLQIVAVVCTYTMETTAALFSLLTSLWLYQKETEVLRMLSKIENCWDRVKTGYKRVSMDRRMQAIWFFVFLFFAFIYDCVMMYEFYYSRFPVAITIRYPARFVAWIDIYHLISDLQYIREQYTNINYALLWLTRMLHRREISSKYCLKEVTVLSEIHFMLRKLCRLHNWLFGVQLCFISLYLKFAFTRFLYTQVLCATTYIIPTYEKNFFSLRSSIVLHFTFWLLVYILFCFNILDVFVSTRDKVSIFLLKCEFLAEFFLI